mgnify:CR=1 FL=1
MLTWAIARDATHRLLPMAKGTLKALSWDLVAFRVSASVMASVWAAVQARHHMLDLVPPLSRRGEFSAWAKSVAAFAGRPLDLKLPIHKSVVHRLLAWRPDTAAQHRARLVAALATLACLRVSEAAQLQACDLRFDHFTGYGAPGYEGTCGVYVTKRKNDSIRRGHLPGLGRAANPSLDIVHQLRLWLKTMELEPRHGCQKRQRPAARCLVCPPLFPRLRRVEGGMFVSSEVACSRQMLSDDIRRAVSWAGCDVSRFSSISARKRMTVQEPLAVGVVMGREWAEPAERLRRFPGD